MSWMENSHLVYIYSYAVANENMQEQYILGKKKLHSILCCELFNFDSFSANIWALKSSLLILLSNSFIYTLQQPTNLRNNKNSSLSNKFFQIQTINLGEKPQRALEQPTNLRFQTPPK